MGEGRHKQYIFFLPSLPLPSSIPLRMSTPSSKRLCVKPHKLTGVLMVFVEGSDVPIHNDPEGEQLVVVDEMNWLELTLYACGFSGGDRNVLVCRWLLKALADVKRPTVHVYGGPTRFLRIGTRHLDLYKVFPPGLCVPDDERPEIEQIMSREPEERRAAFWEAVGKAPSLSPSPSAPSAELKKLRRELDAWREWAMKAEGEYERLRETYGEALSRLDRLHDDIGDWETFYELRGSPDSDPED